MHGCCRLGGLSYTINRGKIVLLSASPECEARCRCRQLWLTRNDYHYYGCCRHIMMTACMHTYPIYAGLSPWFIITLYGAVLVQSHCSFVTCLCSCSTPYQKLSDNWLVNVQCCSYSMLGYSMLGESSSVVAALLHIWLLLSYGITSKSSGLCECCFAAFTFHIFTFWKLHK